MEADGRLESSPEVLVAAPLLTIGLVDRSEMGVEAGGIFDGPEPVERRSQQVHVPQPQRANCNDSLENHGFPTHLSCWRA